MFGKLIIKENKNKIKKKDVGIKGLSLLWEKDEKKKNHLNYEIKNTSNYAIISIVAPAK